MNKVKLSIVIISYNTKLILKDCLNSILVNTKEANYEIVVVDNGSTDGSLKMLRQFSQKFAIRVVANRINIGFASANNQGMRVAGGDYILLLNSDTIIHDNLLAEMIRWMDNHADVGVSSCLLVNKNGGVQGNGGYFPSLCRVMSWMTIQDLPFIDNLIKPFHPIKARSFFKNNNFYRIEKEIDWLTGAFFFLRRKAFVDVGYFDEDYFMYTEDVDYCYRLKKKGWKAYLLPNWKITHIGGASGELGSAVIKEFKGIKIFYKKHYPKWQYPFLRFFLKIGAVGRFILFGLLEGKKGARVYAEAFREA